MVVIIRIFVPVQFSAIHFVIFQFPVDDDLAYLASVQSPRPNPTTGNTPKVNLVHSAQVHQGHTANSRNNYQGHTGIHGNRSTVQVNGNYRPPGSGSTNIPVTKGGYSRSSGPPKSPEIDYSINWSRAGDIIKNGRYRCHRIFEFVF